MAPACVAVTVAPMDVTFTKGAASPWPGRLTARAAWYGDIRLAVLLAGDLVRAGAADREGYAQNPATIKSSGQTPYGFDLTADGSLIVSQAFGGAPGAAAASSYKVSGAGDLTLVSGSVGDTRSEVCWVALTKDDRFAYVTNFGDGTVSCYEITADRSLRLHEPVAGSTGHGGKGLRDEAISGDGRYLYAIDPDAQKLRGWAVSQGGQLRPVGEFGGVPDTVAGLAAG
jgi:6-phosphogluconolactonase